MLHHIYISESLQRILATSMYFAQMTTVGILMLTTVHLVTAAGELATSAFMRD